jgi:hypothetical protein
MKKILFCFILLVVFNGCDECKWETIDGSGISEEPKDIERTIYFEDENKGIIGGYTFHDDSNVRIPISYVTTDGGKKWEELRFDSLMNTGVKNVYLHDDSLMCETDSVKLISIDGGKTFNAYKDSFKIFNPSQKTNTPSSRWFEFEGKRYVRKECYENTLASVIICSDYNTLNDFYFVSFDKGKNWNFIQKELGDNRAKFLLEDKYLYRYHLPLGLQRLRLK